MGANKVPSFFAAQKTSFFVATIKLTSGPEEIASILHYSDHPETIYNTYVTKTGIHILDIWSNPVTYGLFVTPFVTPASGAMIQLEQGTLSAR